MTHETIIINNPENYPAPFCIESWTRQVLTELGIQVNHIEITLLSMPEIQQLNNQYFQNNCPTDTISFNIDEQIDEQYIETGDVYLCPQQIEANAKRFETSIDKEFKIVIIHSILHLIGHTDSTPTTATQMMQRQTEIYTALTR